MKKYLLDSDDFNKVCDDLRRVTGYYDNFEYAGEGSLLSFNMAICTPCEAWPYRLIVREKYLNCWSSIYEAVRYTRREYEKNRRELWEEFYSYEY